jgi:RND superfamily putative drug exporter
MRRLADFVVRWPLLTIAFWVALAVALPLSLPSLNDMAQKHPLAMLPGDAPSNVAARQMEDAFQETGNDNLLLVVLTDERELDSADEATYRKLVEALSRDQRDVVMVQDFIGTPSLREFMTSKDNKAWVLPVGLTGALGTPESYAAFNRVSEIVRETTAASALDVHLAGPAATVADRAQTGAPCMVRRNSVSESPAIAAPSLADAALASPLNFTNPPNGKAATCHLVPRRSTRDISTGPKPMEKTSASIPDHRATM